MISGKIQEYWGASQHHYRAFPGALREIKMSVVANVGPGGALVYTHSASSYLLTLQAPMGLSAASWSSVGTSLGQSMWWLVLYWPLVYKPFRMMIEGRHCSLKFLQVSAQYFFCCVIIICKYCCNDVWVSQSVPFAKICFEMLFTVW